MEFFRDPIWTFVACCAGVLGVFVPLLFTMLLNRKRIVCEVLSNSTIISVAEDVKKRIKIAIDGNEIENASLISLRFTNSGFTSVKEGDYAENINITFSPETEILEANITDVNPNSLTPVLNFDKSKVEINPLLLNRNDYFTIKILVKGNASKINIKDRILGIKRIKVVNSGENADNFDLATRVGGTFVVGYAAGLVLLLFILLTIFAITTNENSVLAIVFATLNCGGMLFTTGISVAFAYNIFSSFKKPR